MDEFPDELAGFDKAWNGNARKQLPGWTGSFLGHNGIGMLSQPVMCFLIFVLVELEYIFSNESMHMCSLIVKI